MQQIRSGAIGFCWLYPPNAVSQRSSHPELFSASGSSGEHDSRLRATPAVTGYRQRDRARVIISHMAEFLGMSIASFVRFCFEINSTKSVT